jgi:hypothetical protein
MFAHQSAVKTLVAAGRGRSALSGGREVMKFSLAHIYEREGESEIARGRESERDREK